MLSGDRIVNWILSFSCCDFLHQPFNFTSIQWINAVLMTLSHCKQTFTGSQCRVCSTWAPAASFTVWWMNEGVRRSLSHRRWHGPDISWERAGGDSGSRPCASGMAVIQGTVLTQPHAHCCKDSFSQWGKKKDGERPFFSAHRKARMIWEQPEWQGTQTFTLMLQDMPGALKNFLLEQIRHVNNINWLFTREVDKKKKLQSVRLGCRRMMRLNGSFMGEEFRWKVCWING